MPDRERGRDSRQLSVIVIPDGASESRTYRIGYGRLRVLGILGVVLGLFLVGVVGTWSFFVARSLRVGTLETRLEGATQDRRRLEALAAQLTDLERRYDRIRDMFGIGAGADPPSDLWLPPPGSGSGRTSLEPSPESSLPTSWPLTERGFLTQPLLEGADGAHPGVDIAVPTDSYIRASGAGTVLEAGESDVYGWYVVVDHGDRYRSRYAHASTLLVQEGQRVRRNEVIALTGSSGRSTAPHLHFEILLDGEAIDPLDMVVPP